MGCGQQEEQRRIAVHGQAADLAIVAGVAYAPAKGRNTFRARVGSAARQYGCAVALRRAIPFVQGG
jgi:hypothetical protein